jgi:hypothetical protein
MMHLCVPRYATTLFRLTLLPLACAVLGNAPAAASNDVPPGAGTVGSPTRPPSITTTHTVRRHFFGANDCLRAVAAGVITRNDGSPGHGTITLPAGPSLANIVWAGLYWDVYHNGTVTNAVNLNGVAVAPVAIGTTPSPCWPETFTTAYFADVTGLVDAGANVLTGLDDSGINGVPNETPGSSLVVVYRSANSTACEIIVMDGNDMVAGNATSNVVPVTCGDGIPATLWFMGGDGQPGGGDSQEWNGVALGDGDDFEPSDPIEPGANPNGGWDTDARAILTGPPSTATVDGFGDCLNWVATLIEVGVHSTDVCGPTPTEKGTWGRLKVHYR